MLSPFSHPTAAHESISSMEKASCRRSAGDTVTRRRRPWLLATTAVAVAYIGSQAVSGVPGLSRTNGFFAIMLASLVGFRQFLGSGNTGQGRWIWPPFSFAGYCVLSAGLSLAWGYSIELLQTLVAAFVGGCAIGLAIEQGVPMRAILYGQVLANSLNIFAGLCQLGPQTDPGFSEVRFSGFTGNANALALQLLFGSCLIWHFSNHANLFMKGFALGAAFYAVLTTGSRKALLLVPVLWVIVGLQVIGRRRHPLAVWLSTGCLLVLLFFGAAWLLTSETAKSLQSVERLSRMFDGRSDDSLEERQFLIRRAAELWAGSPLIGYGFDSFRSVSGTSCYAHNNYMELLANGGLLGLCLFYMIHIQILRRARWLALTQRLSLYCFVAGLLAADFGYVSYMSKQTVMLLMVLLGTAPNSRLRRPKAWEPATTPPLPGGRAGPGSVPRSRCEDFLCD